MALRKAVYELNSYEVELLKEGKTNPDVVTDYFFRTPGQKRGWIFDWNFDPEGAWQKKVHSASQKRIVVIGGFGSGKTKGVALSACVHSLLTADFSFMNCAPQSWQSELMYNFIMKTLGRGTVFEKIIYHHRTRPYPMIELRFRIEGEVVMSTLEFMSVDKTAKNILSWEGDWVNIDEAGLIDDLGGTIINLGSRMRGIVRVGDSDKERARLGRMSLCSNSWDNPELWYRYDLARELPDDYLTLTVSSRHNHNITEDQLRLMLKDIPEEEHDRFIDGARPEGRGNYFAKNRIYSCEDENYSNFILGGYNSGDTEFDVETTHGCGVTYFQIPASKDHIYMLLGDPGIGGAPNRNAPVLQVWDVTDFPKYKATLAALYWGNGKGSITPFYRQLFRFMIRYNPVVTAVDNTGTQKNTSEVLNNYITSGRIDKESALDFLGERLDLSSVLKPYVDGMDFSGGKKPAYLIAGRLMLEAGLFSWPKFVTGMRSQLSNYDPEKDNTAGNKIAQDLVATYCMSAFAVQSWFRIDPAKVVPAKTQKAIAGDLQRSRRSARYPRQGRRPREKQEPFSSDLPKHLPDIEIERR